MHTCTCMHMYAWKSKTFAHPCRFMYLCAHESVQKYLDTSVSNKANKTQSEGGWRYLNKTK